MTKHDAPKRRLVMDDMRPIEDSTRDWEAWRHDQEYARREDQREAARELLDAHREAFAEGWEDGDDD